MLFSPGMVGVPAIYEACPGPVDHPGRLGSNAHLELALQELARMHPDRHTAIPSDEAINHSLHPKTNLDCWRVPVAPLCWQALHEGSHDDSPAFLGAALLPEGAEARAFNPVLERRADLVFRTIRALGHRAGATTGTNHALEHEAQTDFSTVVFDVLNRKGAIGGLDENPQGHILLIHQCASCPVTGSSKDTGRYWRVVNPPPCGGKGSCLFSQSLSDIDLPRICFFARSLLCAFTDRDVFHSCNMTQCDQSDLASLLMLFGLGAQDSELISFWLPPAEGKLILFFPIPLPKHRFRQ
jgi:hypothetical protein